MIARVGLTWQAATCSVPGITLPIRPTFFGKTPTISLSEQHWRISRTLFPPLLFPHEYRVLIAAPPARMEASPPQPAPIGLPAWTSSPLRRGRRLKIFCLAFSGCFQDLSVVERWLTGQFPPTRFSCSVMHMWSVLLAFCLLEFEAGDIVAY